MARPAHDHDSHSGPVSPKDKTENAYTRRMNPEPGPGPPSNETSSPGLIERVRDLTLGRLSATSSQSRQSSYAASASNAPRDTASTRLTSLSLRHSESESTIKGRWLQGMDRGRPLKDRIGTIKTACAELQRYSTDTLMAVWTAIEDMASVDANPEARQAAFEALQESALHRNLSPDQRLKLFNTIITPIPASNSRLQILALNNLTRSGRNVTPFRQEFSTYLVNTLKGLFNATLDARSALKKNRSRRPIIEEEILGELLALIDSVLGANPTNIEGDDLGKLVQHLIFIANKTTVQDDLDQVAFLFRKLSASLSIPLEHLEPCIEVLCGIACTTDPCVGEATWSGIQNLLGPPYQARVIAILLSILINSPKDRQTITVRGALLLVKHIVEANGVDGLPVIETQQLLNALQATAPTSSRLQLDCLQIILSCLSDQEIEGRLLASDWSALDSVIYRATTPAQNAIEVSLLRPSLTQGSPLAAFVRNYRAGTFPGSQDLRKVLDNLAYNLESRWEKLDISQRALTLSLSLYVGCYGDSTMLDMAIDHIVEDRLIFPPAQNWVSHLRILLEAITFDPLKPIKLRHRVLASVADIIRDAGDEIARLKGMQELLAFILKRMAKETEISLTNVLADFLAQHALDAEDETFEAVLAFIVDAARLVDMNERSIQSRVAFDTQSNRAATSLVWLFQKCLMRRWALRTRHCFDALMAIASNGTVPTDSRLTTMKLLTRLRCNSSYSLKVVSIPDSLGLAAALCRTEASAQEHDSGRGNSSRASIVTDPHGGRTGRTSGIEMSRNARSRSTTRSGTARDHSIKATPPLWMYPGSRGLPIEPSEVYSTVVFTHENSAREYHEDTETATLEMETWLSLMMEILQNGSDWEIYSYVLVHLPSQLTNIALFSHHTTFVRSLHRLILSQLRTGSFHEPPTSTGVKKGDVALCLYNTMTVLLPYQEHLGREHLDETVRVFYIGIKMWDRAAKCCIHALALCSYEIPSNLRRSLPEIIQKMSQIVTQSHLAVDILEFLAGLVRLPQAYQIAGPESQEILRTIFGICISYIHHAREQREKSVGSQKLTHVPARNSGLSSKSSAASEPSPPGDVQKELPEYVFTLAYHVVTFWFLAIDIRERSKHVGWIVKNLTWKDESGNESMEEQSQVTLDMIHRTAYNDLGETQANADFRDANGSITKETWLYGMSIITLETVQANGLTLITKRQASGTTHAMYQQYTAQLPPHHTTMSSFSTNTSIDTAARVFPQHILLQLGFTIAPVPIPLQPILLPDDDSIKRAISSFDRNDTVDGHKAGVIYIAPRQTAEASILANDRGSKVYEDFLSGLGTKVRLKDAKFNTQGLDRVSNTDGTHTYAWRDRVTEIVFHVTTMMPTLDHELQCTNKKRHIGNDYVNIIFNESGLPFRFETFASQFNHMNIVITPEVVFPRHPGFSKTITSDVIIPEPCDRKDPDQNNTAFFIVQTLCSPSFPQVSPTATPKVVSASALPAFVRQLALNASVLSLVWSNREGGENVSSWRNRLKEIIKLRQRYANTGISANVSYPGMGNPSDRGGAPSYIDGDRWTGRATMAGMAEDQLLHSADFTRWN